MSFNKIDINKLFYSFVTIHLILWTLIPSITNNNLPNYYEILGVEMDATYEEIKKNFRELAKKTHPDKTKEDSEEEMIQINKAYEILSDKTSREKYDRYMK